MAQQIGFQKKLAGILALCKENGNVIETAAVEEYFEEEQLTDEQMDLVFDYLLSQKIVVKGYVKNGGTLTSAEQEKGLSLSEEEKRYLSIYEEELRMMKSDDPYAEYLPEVVTLAKEMHRADVFIGDLIQEGNMGLIMAATDGAKSKKTFLQAARSYMQVFLEADKEEKMQDLRMVEKVNALDETITQLSQELGRKVTIEEVAQAMNITEEEIEEILELAGEEAPEEE